MKLITGKYKNMKKENIQSILNQSFKKYLKELDEIKLEITESSVQQSSAIKDKKSFKNKDDQSRKS